MKNFKLKLKNLECLAKNLNVFENPVLKESVIEVIEGEAGGWRNHSSWTEFCQDSCGPGDEISTAAFE